MAGWKQILHRIRQGISSGLFPDICFCCNEFIERAKYADEDESPAAASSLVNETAERIFAEIMAPCLCSECIDGYLPVTPPFCTRCGEQFISRSVENHLCGRCISADIPGKKRFVSARACGQYSGTLQKLIHTYKYHGKIGLGRPLGALLHIYLLKHYDNGSIDLILPVPLHRQKLVKRGFDQVMGMLCNWPWSAQGRDKLLENGMVLCEDILIRVKNTETQTGFDRKQRGENVKNAFAVTDKARIRNKRILLIDDVYTTGATLEECSSALYRTGASQVCFLTLARAM